MYIKSRNGHLKINTKVKQKFFVLFILGLFLLTNITGLPIENTKAIQTADAPIVSINIEPNSIIYEGALINCDISGAENKWWWIDRNQNGIRDSDESKHYTFQNDDPQIFRPESTPIGQDYIDLCVTASNNEGETTSSVTIKLYKIWFGEYHWHSLLCDGSYDPNLIINNTRIDDYLDWLGSGNHAEKLNDTEWDILKAALNYSNDNPCPGSFSTFPGYEYSGGPWFKSSKTGHMNVLCKNFDAERYLSEVPAELLDKNKPHIEWDDLFYELHQNETGKGRWAIAIPHHTITGQTGLGCICLNILQGLGLTDLDHLGPPETNFQVLFNDLSYPTKYQAEQYRLDFLRGTEVIQGRGESIGGLTKGFSRLYYCGSMPAPPFRGVLKTWIDQTWTDWGVFEASQTYNKGQQRFGFFGATDQHSLASSHLGNTTNNFGHSYAGGLTACWAVHNVREEIFEALNTTNVYALTPLKIRVLAMANGKRFGQWNSLTTPVTISISINASSAETDGQAYPYGAEEKNADFPHNVTDIWIIKNTDNDRTNRIKAEVIHHKEFTGKNSNIYYEYVYDGELKPGDYFWIAVDQEEDSIMSINTSQVSTTQLKNKHRAWISPFFVAAVGEELAANAGGPYNGIKNGLIQFHGVATGGTPPYTWHWDFGDGIISTLQNPTHNYSNSGTYNVKLTVTDNEGKNDTNSATAIIAKKDLKKPEVKIIRLWIGIGVGKAIILPRLTFIRNDDMFIFAEVADDWGIDRVEFYINNKLMYTDNSPPYAYTWVKKSLFICRYRVKAVAYDDAGNKASNIINVWKFP